MKGPRSSPEDRPQGNPARRRPWWKLVLGSLAALALAGALTGGYLYHRALGGYHEESLEHAGVQRGFGYVLPSPFDPARSSPLVILLHGAGMDAKTMAILANLDVRSHADRHHAILVYPNAIERLWNDGMGGTHPKAAEAEDSGFVAALVGRFVDRFHGDSNRVYLLGVSNGGALGYRLACEHPGRFTAVASFIGGMATNWLREATPLPPMPVRILNSTRDPLVRWEGGPVAIGDDPPIALLAPVDQNVAYWTNRNRAGPTPRITRRPDANTTDGSTVTEYTYTGVADVVVVKVEGADHSVPTTQPRPWNGPGTNRDVDAVPEALDFLFQFRRDPAGRITRDSVPAGPRASG